MKRLHFILLLIVLFAGCVREKDWELSDTAPKLMVVDAILTDQPGTQSVDLHYSVDLLNEKADPVTGAEVIITTEDSTWILTEDTLNRGKYLTRPGFAAPSGQTYTLQVFLDGSTYSAKAVMEAGIVFDPLIYAQNEDGSYSISFVAEAFRPENPAMWEVLLDWSEVEGFNPADSLKNRARLLFYTLPTIDVTEIFAPEVEAISFPAGTVITERRYSLSPAHAEFVRAMLSETSWQGGWFGTAPANTGSNLSSGATGFFAVCGVTSLSFTVAP